MHLCGRKRLIFTITRANEEGDEENKEQGRWNGDKLWKNERRAQTQQERMGGRTGGTVIRLLSRCARGSAVPLIIDVVGNLCRQETKLPAVPAHYDIIWEGWPTAGVASRHPSRPEAPAVHLHTCQQMNTHFLHIAFQTDVHNTVLQRNAWQVKGREYPGRVPQRVDKQNFEPSEKKQEQLYILYNV